MSGVRSNEQRLELWGELGLAGLNAFCKTLENWLLPIAN